MAPLRPPQWLLWGAALIWFASIAGLVLLGDHHSVRARTGKELVSVAAQVSAAVVVGSGALELWRRWSWRRRTQWVVFELVEQVRYCLVRVVTELSAVVDAVTDDGEKVFMPWISFSLPLTPAKRKAAAEMASDWKQRGERHSRKTLPDPDHPAAMEVAMAALLGRGAELMSSVRELSVYASAEHAADLLSATARLSGEITYLVDPFPGAETPGQAKAELGGYRFGQSMTTCGNVMDALDRVYRDMQTRLTDRDLRSRVWRAGVTAGEIDSDEVADPIWEKENNGPWWQPG